MVFLRSQLRHCNVSKTLQQGLCAELGNLIVSVLLCVSCIGYQFRAVSNSKFCSKCSSASEVVPHITCKNCSTAPRTGVDDSPDHLFPPLCSPNVQKQCLVIAAFLLLPPDYGTVFHGPFKTLTTLTLLKNSSRPGSLFDRLERERFEHGHHCCEKAL